jgi:HNH endonuclease
VRILERDGRPLSVGRRTRTVPPALARALRSRDGGCRFPGCTERRFVDAHHIEHWAHGGRTELGNLVQLCRRHHRLLHEGGYRLERGSKSALVFRRPDGQRIRAAAGLPGDRRRLRTGNGPLGIRPETATPRLSGERFDLGYAVDVIAAADPRFAEEGAAAPG